MPLRETGLCQNYLTVTVSFIEYFLKKTDGLSKQSRAMRIFSYSSNITYVVGTKKSRLAETVLLSNHNICHVTVIKIKSKWCGHFNVLNW